MIFRDNSGAQSTPSARKKFISTGLLATLLLSTAICEVSLAEVTPGQRALDVAASIPGKTAAAAERPSEIEEAAEATISSVKGIV